MKRILTRLGLGLVLACMLMGNSCNNSPPTARDRNVQAQTAIMERATQAVPVPQVNNFLSREAVAKQVARLDEAGKVFYVYVYGNSGQEMGYYVSNTRPVPTCTLLTPPDNVWYDDGNGSGAMSQRLTAPGLGGTYSPGPCDTMFFFDAVTDAYIEIGSLSYMLSDQPLSVNAKWIRVVKREEMPQ